MLKMISVGEYTRALLIMLCIYYGVVLTKYYGKAIKKKLTGKRAEKIVHEDKV